MDLRVVGCHGGESPRHKTTAFVLDEKLAIDAGSLTSRLTLKDQFKLQACLISHAHLDHIRDLATIADNRFQADCGPLDVCATQGTLRALKRHFFNNAIWPDFSEIPNNRNPTIRFVEIKPNTLTKVAGFNVRAIPVDHTIEASGFIISDKRGALGFSGDTGPTTQLWNALNETPHLKALLMEVSFPNREQKLAKISGHHTPSSLARDLKKYAEPEDLPTLLYHIKPVFQREVERECARLKHLNLEVPVLDDEFVL